MHLVFSLIKPIIPIQFMCLKPKAWGHLSFDVCGGGVGLPVKKVLADVPFHR